MTEISRTRSREWCFVELELIRARWSLATHPYLTTLAAGSDEDVAIFVGEYDHVVVALAQAARRACDASGGLLHDALRSHAAWRQQRILRWRAIARVSGWASTPAFYGDDPYPGTLDCALLLDEADRPLARQLAVLWLMARTEAELGERLEGAAGARPELAAPLAAYFDPPADTDLLAAALEGQLADTDPFALLRTANAAARGCWHMFDDLEAYRS